MLLFIVSEQMQHFFWLLWSNICLQFPFRQKVRSGWAGCMVTPRRSLTPAWKLHNRIAILQIWQFPTRSFILMMSIPDTGNSIYYLDGFICRWKMYLVSCLLISLTSAFFMHELLRMQIFCEKLLFYLYSDLIHDSKKK